MNYWLQRQGLLEASCAIRENNRLAKFYELTTAGRHQPAENTERWNRRARGTAAIAQTRPVAI